MFCGTCMHDNTWAHALRLNGFEVSLIPTYTPIRVDEENQSLDEIFMGGINAYLNYHVPMWNKLPRWSTRWLDHPKIIQAATRWGVSNDAKHLGGLTVSMLDGENGPHQKQFSELADAIAHKIKPDIVCFSNSMLCGVVPALKKVFSGPILCAMQGEDVFLDDLNEPYRAQALEKIHQQASLCHGFVVHSNFYASFMRQYANLPEDRFHVLPLGIDLDLHTGVPTKTEADESSPIRIGYFARVCPEKGLLQLVNAFCRVHAEYPNTELLSGGFLGSRDAKYFKKVQESAADLGTAFRHIGSPEDHRSKVEFLSSLDIFSVPTIYREPKGIYALEAIANGIPVVLPNHGAFPEMIEKTEAGLLFEPESEDDLVECLLTLVRDQQLRQEYSQTGHEQIRKHFSFATLVESSTSLFQKLGI